jgi:signal peptidase I
MRTHHARKLASTLLGLIVLGCLWFYFAPAALGGSTTYVVTDGISMEPRFHTGDLALVRSQSSYHVGEIVAYHNKMLGTIVLHRIVGLSGDRYLFKGDNNNFVDFEHPLASQLIGALWIHVAGAGATIKSIRSPAVVGILVAIGFFLFTGVTFTRRKRRRGRQRRAGENGAPAQSRAPQGAIEPIAGVLAIGFIALLPFIALALLAFTRPPTARRPFDVAYKQSGTLSYSAAAAPGPAYASGRAVTGEPLFTHVLRGVDFRFAYRFDTAAQHSLTGKASLIATVASTSGWHTTLPLGQPTYIHGDHALVTGTLDLTSLVALVHDVDTTTAVSGSYTLTIVPHVSANGSVDLMPLHTTFAPKIQFTLSELEAQPLVAAAGASAAAAQSAASMFTPSSSGSVTGTRYQPLYLSFKLTRLSVATARTIALSGIVLVVLALMAALALVRPRLRDALAAIRARYGHLIVPVERVWQLPGVAVIDVADMDALAHIAGHYDRSILYELTEHGHTFWVTDESGQFRFVLDAPAPVVEAAVEHAPALALAPELEHEIAAPAWSAEQQSSPPSWEESPTAELAAVPAWTADAEPAAIAPVWAESVAEEPAPAPAWEESYEVYAPAWAGEGERFDASASDVLASEVYADELELGGVFRVSGSQPAAPESLAAEEAAPEVWQPEEEPATVVLEPRTARAPGKPGGISPTRAGAVSVHVTGF